MRTPLGFTIPEPLIVLVVGAVLTGFAVQALAGVQGRTAANHARMVLVALHARTRAVLSRP